MPHKTHVVLAAWSATVRHSDMASFLAELVASLLPEIRCRQAAVWRIDPEGCLTFVARANPRGPTEAESDATAAPVTLTERDRASLHRCLRARTALAVPIGRRGPAFLDHLARTTDAVRIIAPLGTNAPATGIAVFVLPADVRRSADAVEVLASLAEPLAAMLIREVLATQVASLRVAGETERESLRRKLGRDDTTDQIIGERSGLRLVMERVRLVARTDLPTLLLGETGSGKEVIARAIHDRSPRTGRPFLRVNCGAIPPDLIDSELFGHEAGAFTGATRTRKGWFDRADGGTLFLDEVGELPLAAQVRLLRVLQEGVFERVGGEASTHVSVRIVAATHRDLPSLVQRRLFREDLWYRLAAFPILVPPLRERREDIAALARHCAHRAAIRFGLREVELTTDDIALLESYEWPGNVRELASVIDRAVILGNGETLAIATALGQPAATRPLPETEDRGTPTSRIRATHSIGTLDDAIRSRIEMALHSSRGVIEGPQGAARQLGINPHTLRSRMRRLGIAWARFRPA